MTLLGSMCHKRLSPADKRAGSSRARCTGDRSTDIEWCDNHCGDHRPVLQLSDSGVDVVLSAPRYEHGQLKLSSAITNQSSQSVIAVRLAIRVQDAQGVWSEEQEVTIWQSIKRMAETYLRPRTSVEGKPLELNLAEQSQYTLHATIKQIETR